MGDEAFPDALPLQHRFHWYEFERVLGQGGFGITYLARDTNLDQVVAIKEYLPSDFAHRRSDAMVCARSGPLEERYRWGLDRFLIEARTLARFDHPNIVRVLAVFEANGTAYMVMRFEAGENLGALLERRGTLSESEVLRILLPVIDGLEGVHHAGFIHRDIKPENIHIRNDGSPVLLDFGSARQLLGRAKTMTILVAPGYAPLEQYYGDAANQGPWTDIYGLGATAYRAIAGFAPVDAIARTKGVLGSTRETMRTAADLGRGRYHDQLLAAIDHALRLNETDRPQSLAQWRAEIAAAVIPAHVILANAGIQGSGSRVDPGVRRDDLYRGEAPSLAAALREPATPQPTDATAAPAPRELPVMREARRALPGRTLPWTLGGAAVAALAAGAWWFSAPTRMSPAYGLQVSAPPAISPSSSTVIDPVLPVGPERSASAPTQAPVASQSMAAPIAGVGTPAASPTPSTPGRGVPSPPKSPGTRPTATVLAPAPVPPVAGDVARAPAPASAPLPSLPSAETASTQSPPAKPAPPVLVVPAPAPPPASNVAPNVVAEFRPPPAAAFPKADDPLDMALRAIEQGDHKRAIELLKPLGQGGDSRAQTLLGEQYEHGRGAPQSDFQAYIWYSLAARRGSENALAARARLAARLQPAEVQQGDRQADRLAERWRRSGAGGQK